MDWRDREVSTPYSVTTQNSTELPKRHLAPDTLKYLKYHGPSRTNEISVLLDNDIVFTTYATVAYEYSCGNSLIHKVMWYRVVLDEGAPTNEK